MSVFFKMPVQVYEGDGCVVENYKLFSSMGKKAMLVTGKNSAKVCGALDDTVKALELCGIEYDIFDKIMSNPTVEVVYEGAEAVKKSGADFIIGIGGGSPMDGAKAFGLLVKNEGISPEDYLAKKYVDDGLPLVLIPTTCGTGSEVTQYAVITNDFLRTKSAVYGESTFARLAFVDKRYLYAMKRETLVNTAFDAFTHNAEGYFSVKANYVSDKLAIHGMTLFSECISALKSGDVTEEIYDKLMKASVIGGMVIAHTGTVAVHSLGYSYTYFKGIDHGRANAILFAEFLRFAQGILPERASDVLGALGYGNVDELKASFAELIGPVEPLTEDELKTFCDIGEIARSLKNSKACPVRADIERIYRKASE